MTTDNNNNNENAGGAGVGIDLDIRQQENELRSYDADLLLESKLMNIGGSKDATNTPPPEVVNENNPAADYQYVPLRMGGNGGTHMVSEGSKRLIDSAEVTLDDLTTVTSLFYEKAFQDKTLDRFIQSHDDPHARRFALWIHQKLSGSTLWDEERRSRNLEPVTLSRGIQHVVHDRSSAHAAAWYSKKRPDNEVGRHFTLEECRVWMRLHFWALRESGVMEKSPSFADYYVRFIGHFVRVYENSAPAFARESLRWSSNPNNIHVYIHQNGREMKDVLGLSRTEAEAELPEHELADYVWPYNQHQP